MPFLGFWGGDSPPARPVRERLWAWLGSHCFLGLPVCVAEPHVAPVSPRPCVPQTLLSVSPHPPDPAPSSLCPPDPASPYAPDLSPPDPAPHSPRPPDPVSPCPPDPVSLRPPDPVSPRPPDPLPTPCVPQTPLPSTSPSSSSPSSAAADVPHLVDVFMKLSKPDAFHPRKSPAPGRQGCGGAWGGGSPRPPPLGSPLLVRQHSTL